MRSIGAPLPTVIVLNENPSRNAPVSVWCLDRVTGTGLIARHYTRDPGNITTVTPTDNHLLLTSGKNKQDYYTYAPNSRVGVI